MISEGASRYFATSKNNRRRSGRDLLLFRRLRIRPLENLWLEQRHPYAHFELGLDQSVELGGQP